MVFSQIYRVFPIPSFLYHKGIAEKGGLDRWKRSQKNLELEM